MKLFGSKIEILPIFIIVVILYLSIPSSQGLYSCYQDPANTDIQLDVEFNKYIKFEPKRFFIELEIDRIKKSDKKPYIKSWKVEMGSKDCTYRGLVLPVISEKYDQKYSINIYSDDTRKFMIEEFKFRYIGRPVDEYFSLPGLNKIANITVKISNDPKWIKNTESQNMQYFGELGDLDIENDLCLLIFKTGNQLGIKIDKKYLEWWKIGHQYLVEITMKDVFGNKETKKVWLAKAMACSPWMIINPTKIYIADDIDYRSSKRKIRVAFHGTFGKKFMSQTIIKNGQESLIEVSADTIQLPIFDLEAVNVNLAISRDDGLMLYDTVIERHLCNKDGISYVEVHKVGDVIVEKRGHIINNDLQKKYNVAIIGPGTDAEVNKCLK